jgi:2-dehydro-3-deoxyphosphogluconate aldolase/(4S)-4-hydroxy-2-oxoglutarate aldolase
MGPSSTLRRILASGIVAIVRANESGRLVETAAALAEGGVSVVEITMTVPGALEIIRAVRQALSGRVVLGAGTVLDAETARLAIAAGAEFIVTPVLKLEVIRLCRRYGKPVLPGAFTPTEILTAWEAGADIVKLFPAEAGGPSYLKAVRAPLPQVRLMPTGGVDLDTAAAFLKAGACCLGVGSQLVSAQAVAQGDFAAIRDKARRFVEVVAKARQEMGWSDEGDRH